MNQEEILFEIQKTLVRTKERFPTHYANRKGKQVMTDAVWVTNVQAFMAYLRTNYIITPVEP